MPNDASGPEPAWASRNQSTAAPIVLSGSVVGITVSAHAPSEPSPTAQTHLVPPSSMPP